jgi:hypothetical protein
VTASDILVSIDLADIEMVGFENDGGLNELLTQFGIAGDYKSTLPMHLTDVLQRQAPDVIVTRIELLGEPTCSLAGMRDDKNETFLRVGELNVRLALKVMVRAGEHRSSLDLELVMKFEGLADTQRATTDMFVKSQTRLE